MTPPGDPLSDDQLLARLREGDEEAFLTLYRRRQGAIFRFALKMSGSTPAAEDVTQEVFLTLIRDGGRYDPERGSLSGYLFGIARKLLLRQIERSRPDVTIESASQENPQELASTDDPLAELTERERIGALRRAVAHLPRRYREVVVLCDLEEVDYADAALVLGCPIGTVRSRLHRARALLWEKLNEDREPRTAHGTPRALRALRAVRSWI